MKKIVIIILLIGALVGAALLMNKEGGIKEEPKVVLEGDPIDTTMDFYSSWASARRSAEIDPYEKGLVTHRSVSPDFGAKLEEAKEAFLNDGSDMVLCNSIVPERLRTRTIAMKDDHAQIMVLSKGEVLTPIAIAILGGVDGEWKIMDVNCAVGEQGPQIGEFNFEKDGRLLKDSVQAPLDSSHWHLIYERDGVMGYVAQLTLNENTVCNMPDGSATDCGGANFYETMPVSVKGNMTEAGLDVVQIQITDFDPVE